MNSRFIIIAILIMIKVVGVASRARAESLTCPDGTKYSYMSPAYWDGRGTLSKYGEFMVDPNNPKYRCGKRVKTSIGGIRG